MRIYIYLPTDAIKKGETGNDNEEEVFIFPPFKNGIFLLIYIYIGIPLP